MRALFPVMLAVITGLTLPASATALKDFGDAPDGGPAGYGGGVAAHFPSLARSNGARHAKIGPLLLGRAESSENDSRQVDVDQFDDGFSSELVSCGASHVQFVVNAANLPARLRTAKHRAYLNAWFDFNRDGRWAGRGSCGTGGASEWAVKNVAISLASFASRPIQIVEVAVPAGSHVKDIWERATLTLDQRVRLIGGRGRFRFGETEDYGPRPAASTNRGSGRGKAGGPVPDDKPAATCRAVPPNKGPGPPGMPGFMEHGDFGVFHVQVQRGRGTMTGALGPLTVFGQQPEGIQTLLDPQAPIPWTSRLDLYVVSTAEDFRANPLQLVIIPVDIRGSGIGKLHVDCVMIVAHETITPAGANTFSPPGGQQPGTGVGQTIDTTVGPPVITIGGQTTTGGGDGSVPVVM